jgi:hypothetical protein
MFITMVRYLYSIFTSISQSIFNLANRSHDVYLPSDFDANKSAPSVFTVGRTRAVCGGFFNGSNGRDYAKNREDSTQ